MRLSTDHSSNMMISFQTDLIFRHRWEDLDFFQVLISLKGNSVLIAEARNHFKLVDVFKYSYASY